MVIFYIILFQELQFQPIVTPGVFERPVWLTHCGDNRRFIVDQPGRIWILEGNHVLKEPFLDIRESVIFDNERGLLCLAFAPDFVASGYFFVTYIRASDQAAILARFQVSVESNITDPESQVILMEIAQPSPIHKMHGLQFLNDGSLLVAVGDGGPRNDPECRSQNLQNRYGKILRISVQNQLDPPYFSVPSDNPFFGVPGTNPEIYALGLRNPWRMGHDPLTDQVLIGDVGQASFEEINLLKPGANFGWSVMEGLSCFALSNCSQIPPCMDPGFESPIYAYAHGVDCAVIGGPRVRSQLLPDFLGLWAGGDYCSGRFFFLEENAGVWTLAAEHWGPTFFTSFGLDANGDLYGLFFDGRISRLVQPMADFWPRWLDVDAAGPVDLLRLVHRVGYVPFTL
ncbi:MAG: PQQ-dependent sugar dehydrogenase [Acidobacteria bacterium]|nr:PQQ-dependent sugar dehydrogenase [Acidobacteriota bacterium]MCB9397843.1 PQQ-dependent sugar dehydrogenase [Acidobacteriota bacterium]